MLFSIRLYWKFVFFALVLGGPKDEHTPDNFDVVEKDFVTIFGMGNAAIAWNEVVYLYDLKKKLLICEQMKIFRDDNVRISEAFAYPAILTFRNTEYASRNIIVLDCKIANTGKHFYLTKGKEKEAFYLLFKVEQDPEGKKVENTFLLDRHESLKHVPKPPIDDEFGPVYTIWAPDL